MNQFEFINGKCYMLSYKKEDFYAANKNAEIMQSSIFFLTGEFEEDLSTISKIIQQTSNIQLWVKFL